MKTIQRAETRVHPLSIESDDLAPAICSLDTAEMFFSFKPRWQRDTLILTGQAEDTVHIYKGSEYGHRLVVQRPTLRTIDMLNQMHICGNGVFNRADLALDQYKLGKEWMVKNVMLKGRKSGPMKDFLTTTYWSEWHAGMPRPPRDLVAYEDKPCKITGQPNCPHLEIRLFGADALRRAGILFPHDLIALDPRKVFYKYLRVVAFDDDETALIRKLQRRAVADDRREHEGRTVSKSKDRERAAVASNIARMVKRIGQGRAQELFDQFDVEFTYIGLDVLGIPDHLTHHDNRRYHTPKLKLMNNEKDIGFENHRPVTDHDSDGYADMDNAA